MSVHEMGYSETTLIEHIEKLKEVQHGNGMEESGFDAEFNVRPFLR